MHHQGADFEFIKKETKVTPKVCIPSPSLMHFRGGREAIDAKAYPKMDEFWADLARVYNEEIQDLVKRGLKYLQIDDVSQALSASTFVVVGTLSDDGR